MSGGRLAVVASALAPLAVLAVLVAAVSAAVVYPGDDAGPDAGPSGAPSDPSGSTGTGEPDGTPSVPADRQAVTGDGRSAALFTVPDTDDWTVEVGTSIGYLSDDGDGEGVSSPAVYRADFCTDDGVGADRAFVGFSRPVPAEDAGVQEAAQQLVDSWADALSADGESGPSTTVTPVRLDDGSAAWTGAAVVPVTEPESGCDPPAREVRVVSVASESYVASVALVRDVRADGSDLGDGLDADEADDVLRTLSPQ